MSCGSFIHIFRRRFALILCFVLVFSIAVSNTASGAKKETLSQKFSDQAGKRTTAGDFAANSPYYASVEAEYTAKGYRDASGVQITIDASAASAGDKGVIPVRTGVGGNNEKVLVWEEGSEWFEWDVEVPADGLYEIDIGYYPLQGSGGSVQRSIWIDGNLPFREALTVPMYRMWRDEGEPRVNNIGDEVRPRQVEIKEWQTIAVSDDQGMYSRPFKFYLTRGSHKLRLSFVEQPVALHKIVFRSPRQIPSYEMLAEEYAKKGYKNAAKAVTFQAETHTIRKSDPTIRREYDGDLYTVPVSYGDRKLNVMGAYRWRTGNQSITWQFDVEEDGLYRIDMKAAQWWNDGLPSYRQIAVDGRVPFEEMEEYRFEFKREWRLETLSDAAGKPYLFYLTRGSHTLTMTVKLGPVVEIIRSLMEDTLLLSEAMRRIIMITGTNPDPNYEYELENSIPGLLDDLTKLADSMQDKADTLGRISDKKTAIENNFIMIRDQLKSMVRNPRSISRRMNDLNNAQNSLGSWVISLQSSPLVIDWFKAGPPDMETTVKQMNIFQRAYVMFRNFYLSFHKDYDSIGSVYAGETAGPTISVWIARGKEWAEIVKEMADEDFTPKTGININLNVLPASQLNAGNVNTIMLAIASGKAPDVACGVSTDSPVEFAIRDAVLPLDRFKDYGEISGRFYPTVMIPFAYRNHPYGLPETMDFTLMVYRKDILQEIGLQVPDTWEDVYEKVLPVLYQKGLQFYYPHTLGHFLFQLGGQYYSEDGKRTALDRPEAYRAFKELVELYTSYALPVEASFFNRMRTGEMPIGITGFSEYVRLSVAAPELLGRWDIAPIPGHKRPDGTIDHSIAGIAGQASIILKQSEYPEEAWEFLKWWTSADVQVRFGRELEALMGVEARWNTANVEAFKGLPWNYRHKAAIMQQFEWGKEVPVVLGGYFTGRHVTNAWTRSVISGMNIRDSLEKAVKDINKELKSKHEEYGMDME